MKRLLLATAGLLLLAMSPAQAAVCPTPIIPNGQAASQNWQINVQAVLEKICANLDTLVAGGSGAGIGDVNLKQVGGATVSTGTGAQGAASPRVTVATDSATVAGSASLPAGAAIIGKVSIDQTTPGTTNLVSIGTNGTVAATQSGTFTVQPGNTANTTPWLVTQTPSTSGGSSTYSGNVTTAGSGAGTGGVAVDASAGQMYGYAIYNGNASVCYFGAYDQTQALTNLGTTVPKLAIGIPANGGANVAMPNGIPFATAITVSATTTRAGSTACSTGLDINVWYK